MLNAGTERPAMPRAFAGKVTNKADIFSFGVVLWEIITVERPAWRGNLREIRCACEPAPVLHSEKSNSTTCPSEHFHELLIDWRMRFRAITVLLPAPSDAGKSVLLVGA
jgi:hypothetical protein